MEYTNTTKQRDQKSGIRKKEKYSACGLKKETKGACQIDKTLGLVSFSDDHFASFVCTRNDIKKYTW